LHGWLIGSIGSIGFVVAGVIGRLSDCYGRRSLIIAQKLSSLICLAALAFRTELNNNLWVYIGLGVASNAITGGRYGGTTVWNACKQLEEILSNQAPDRIDELPLDHLSTDLSRLQQQRNVHLVRWRTFALLCFPFSDLADCYEAHERSLYFGYYTGLSMFAITIGPLLPVYIPPLAVWDTNFQFAFWLG